MAEFEIKVTELDAGGKDYVFPIRSAWLADELSTLGDAGTGLSAPATDGSFRCSAYMTGPDVIVRGQITGGLVAECSRCLGPAPIDVVDSEFAMLLCARGKGMRPPPGEEDLTPDELDREFYTGDQIVLDDAVREHLLLEVPMQPLCREDCPGLPIPESVRGPADLAAPDPAAEAAPLSPLAKALAAAGLAAGTGVGGERPANGPAKGEKPEQNGKKTKRAR